MLRRRSLLALGLTSAPPIGWTQQRRSLVDPMRLGVDVALIDSGLAQALQRGFGRDTGIAVKLIPGTAQALLPALERGELDAAMTNAPAVEAQFEAQGFVHERAIVASSEFVIVGPLLKPAKKSKGRIKAKDGPRDPAGLLGATSAVEALQKLRDAAAADESIRFLSANDGSGSHVAEQAAWRAARIAPALPWYQSARGSSELLRQARELAAYALVDRGVWLAQGGAPLALLVHGDSGLRVPVHVMRGFRANHPAARLYARWITGPKGRAIVAGQRGYRVTTE
jgi:tungstate transport system substrate-binding protein